MMLPQNDQISTGLFKLADGLCERSLSPGISVAVVTPQYEAHAACGHRAVEFPSSMHRNARFRVGYISELLLSVVALEEVRKGRLDLTTPISDTIVELPNSVFGRDVTLTHLLSHSSGLRAFPLTNPSCRALTWDRFVCDLALSSRQFPPGAVSSYDHANAILASELVCRCTGERSEILIERLCNSILGVSLSEPDVEGIAAENAGQHMTDPCSGRFRSWNRPVRSEDASPSSNLFWRPVFSNSAISMRDLAAIGHALCGFVDTTFVRDPLLSAATRGLLQRPVVRLPTFIVSSKNKVIQPVAIGLAAEHHANGWWGVSTAFEGQCAALRYHPARQISVAVGLNCQRPNLLHGITQTVCSIAAGDTEVPATPKQSTIFPGNSLEGRYSDGGGNSCDVSATAENISSVFRGSSFGSSFVVKVNLSASPPTIESTHPGISMAFFETPGPSPIRGLMFGRRAYRKEGN